MKMDVFIEVSMWKIRNMGKVCLYGQEVKRHMMVGGRMVNNMDKEK